MALVYNIASIVAFSLSVIFLIIAIILWFRFDILKVIGDLSGRTARKSIEKMRASNESGSRKTLTPATVAKQKSSPTEIVKAPPPAPEPPKPAAADVNATEVLSYSSGGDTMFLDERETEANAKQQQVYAEKEDFQMLVDIVIVHTGEIVQ